MGIELGDIRFAGQIHVSCASEPRESFPLPNWKKAFNRFLDGIWSQHDEFAKVVLWIEDAICLYLDEKGEYKLQYNPHQRWANERPTFNRYRVHAVTSERRDLELGLVKFVRNDGMEMLVIEFPALRFMLWKGDSRTDLFYTVVDRTF